jgi:serine/threonine protein kinase
MRQAPGIRLLERISVTNLSEVWSGRRESDGAAVAVKFPAGATSAADLAVEAEVAGRLVSAGLRGVVPALYSATPEPHIVMPWIGGSTLRDIINTIRTEDDRGRACRILMHVMVNTRAVHREGVLHGDLKPENILIGEGYLPWLTDFGMARLIHDARLESPVSRSLDTTGEAWGGTLPYMPPEGLHGDPPTLSWDVYAIGVMLHEILMDRRPDRAASPEALRAHLPWELVDLLVATLAWSPADRLADMERFCDRLRPYQEELALTGIPRLVTRMLRRSTVAAAAFFILYRHACVLALLTFYAAVPVFAILWRAPVVLLAWLPFILLHAVIRWEGPETRREALLRKRGHVKCQE